MYAILLAAGLSTRMGRQKLLLPIGEKTMVETVVDSLENAGFTKICAVFSKETNEAVKDRPGLIRAVNPNPERGQSSSLIIGLSMVPDGEDFCIMLGDLPFAESGGIAELADQFEHMQSEKTCLAPCRDGAFGHPMFYRSVWKTRLASADGDKGGKNILLEREHEIERTEAQDGHFRDIDTQRDYDRVSAAITKREK